MAKKVNQYELDGTFIRTHDSCQDAAEALGKRHGTTISGCAGYMLNKQSAHGYLWRYTDDKMKLGTEHAKNYDKAKTLAAMSESKSQVRFCDVFVRSQHAS